MANAAEGRTLERSLSTQEQDAIVGLRERLDHLGLCELLGSYGFEQDRSNALLFDARLLPRDLRSAIELFVLGGSIAPDQAADLLSFDLMTGLVRVGLAQESEAGLSLGGLRLVNHFGARILCDLPRADARFYHGDDSLALGRLALASKGSVLDLCAGVGAQSILAGLRAREVLAVEIAADAERLFHINCLLNEVSDRVQFRCGDFVEAAPDRMFDTVLCNPPLLPIPLDVKFPFVGRGGEDGLQFATRLLRALPRLLSPAGRCFLVGTLLGDAEGPSVDALAQLTRELGLAALVILPCAEPLDGDAPMFRALIQTAVLCGEDGRVAAERFRALFEGGGYTHLYSFIMVIERAGNGADCGIRMTSHYVRSSAFWVP